VAVGGRSGGLAAAAGEPGLTLRMVYVSLVTLAGVGYGDILPATTSARMGAVTEAVMGQAYLYVMVARLVGMQVSQAVVTRPADASPETERERPAGANHPERSKQPSSQLVRPSSQENPHE